MSFRVKDKQQGITYNIVEEGELLETGDKPIIDMSKKNPCVSQRNNDHP